MSGTISQKLSNGYESAKSGVDYACQKTGNFILDVSKYKQNPDVFQKTIQVAYSILAGVSYYQGSKVLSKITITLTLTSFMHTFLGFLKLPRTITRPITYQSIDDEALKVKILPVIRQATKFTEATTEKLTNERIREILTEMKTNDISYKNTTEFAIVLQDKFNSRPYEHNIELRTIDIPIHKQSRLSKIAAVAFSIGDLLSIPIFLNNGCNLYFGTLGNKLMGLVGLGDLATSIGNTSAFQLAGKLNLDRIGWGVCAVAYANQMVDAIKELRYENLAEYQKNRALLTIISSAAEVIFCSAGMFGLIHEKKAWLIGLAIFAKSIGIVNIVLKDKDPQYQTRFLGIPA
ncbi:MAG: hypothetical protein H0W88_07970 [Parachlamydiaceae bacterium]|nr:hypothetical protein [Parachlamydiaceae bacterium]